MNWKLWFFGLFFAIVSCNCLSAQGKADKDFEKARELFAKGKTEQAESLLLKITDKYADYSPACLALGELYFVRKDFEKAKHYLLSLVGKEESFDLNAYRKLADIYESERKWDSAIVCLNSYLRLAPDKEAYAKRRAEIEHKRDCLRFRVEAFSNPVPFSPENMGGNINSEGNEYLPAMTADLSEILFTRQSFVQEGKPPVEDFFISKREGKQWQKAAKLSGLLNSDFNEGAGCLSPDGRYIYFTRCNAEDSHGSCDIYRSERKGTQWGKPENLGADVNSSSWDAQPSIASDGRTLFFVSNRAGGSGESDIYYSYLKDDGTWTKAKNCGELINTPGKEMSPFIHPSNQMLYFSSDYHCGMGGLDIFYSRLENGRFTRPINLGYPINTEADESSFIVSAHGDYAVYASHGKDSHGGLDLYAFELYEEARPIAVTYMKGKIYDKESKQALKASFEIRNLKTSRIVSSGSSDPISGEYLICLPVGSDYAFSSKAEGYLFFSENFSLSTDEGKEAFEKDIELSKIEIGSSLVLHNIFFANNSSDLLAESFVELNTLAELLKNNPDLRVEIGGHTDNVGGEDYNMKLSQKRAEAVKSYLVEKGTAPQRLSCKGYGFSKPISDNSSEDLRAMNRRTEIRITGK